MALIKCPECNKEISDEARRCPSCGKPIWGKKDKNWSNIVCVCAIITGIIWFFFAYLVDLDREHFEYQFTFIIFGILTILFGLWYRYYYHKKANETNIVSKQNISFFQKHKGLMFSMFIIAILLLIMFFMTPRRTFIFDIGLAVFVVLGISAIVLKTKDK